MKYNRYPIIVLITILLFSCKNDSLDYSAYNEFVISKENGLNNRIYSDSLEFEFQYLTTDMLCYNALKSKRQVDLNQLKKEFDLNHNILLKIRNQHNLPIGGYLNFNFEKDLNWICNRDTFYPELYHHENLSSINQMHNLVLAFDKRENEVCDFDFHISPNQFIESGITVTFNHASITNIPNLKLPL